MGELVLSGLRLVLMLTTAGDAFLAAALKLPGAGAWESVREASKKRTPAPLVSPAAMLTSLTHWGFKVTNTNQIATKTVTTWEKKSQVFLIYQAPLELVS
jgi:hypothetical protein